MVIKLIHFFSLSLFLLFNILTFDYKQSNLSNNCQRILILTEAASADDCCRRLTGDRDSHWQGTNTGTNNSNKWQTTKRISVCSKFLAPFIFCPSLPIIYLWAKSSLSLQHFQLLIINLDHHHHISTLESNSCCNLNKKV